MINNNIEFANLLKQYNIIWGYIEGITPIDKDILPYSDDNSKIAVTSIDAKSSIHLLLSKDKGFDLEKYEKELGDEKLVYNILGFLQRNNVNAFYKISQKEGNDELTGKPFYKDVYRISFTIENIRIKPEWNG